MHSFRRFSPAFLVRKLGFKAPHARGTVVRRYCSSFVVGFFGGSGLDGVGTAWFWVEDASMINSPLHSLKDV